VKGILLLTPATNQSHTGFVLKPEDLLYNQASYSNTMINLRALVMNPTCLSMTCIILRIIHISSPHNRKVGYTEYVGLQMPPPYISMSQLMRSQHAGSPQMSLNAYYFSPPQESCIHPVNQCPHVMAFPPPSTIAVIFAVTGILYIFTRRKNAKTLPPGPKGLPILGNISDMPPPGMPECHHWLKHKDLYGPISSVTVLGQTMVIINDPEIAFELLRDRSAIYSSRPSQVFSGEMYVYAQTLIV
jgi:hypothetical protein